MKWEFTHTPDFAFSVAGTPRTSKIESFATIVDSFMPLTIAAKLSISNDCGSSGHVSVNHLFGNCHPQKFWKIVDLRTLLSSLENNIAKKLTMKLHLKDVKHDPRKTLENPHIKFISNKISEKKITFKFYCHFIWSFPDNTIM